MSRRLAWIALAAYVVALAFAGLWPTPVDQGLHGALGAVFAGLRARGIDWPDYGALESAANVLLFVPLGLLLGGIAGRGRRWIAFAVCVAGSLAVELGQEVLLPHRFASAADVAANSLGAALGVLAAALAGRHRPSVAAAAPNPSRAD